MVRNWGVFNRSVETLALEIGRRVSEVRGERGLTQQGLATAVQASVRWISRVENGEENLTIATLLKLANALEIHVGELLTPPKTPQKVSRGRPRKK